MMGQEAVCAQRVIDMEVGKEGFLDPTFGIHSHKTLDIAQPCHILKPNWKLSSSHSISTPTNINIQFLL